MDKKQKVSLRNDITFKHFFKNNEKALISLLESFLPLAKGRRILSIEILDSFLPTLGNKAKETIMDLRLILDNKETVNVEMQMCSHKFFIERILFYWAKNYLSQLKSGGEYESLHPTYSLVFCDFNLFGKTEDFYHCFSIRMDQEPYSVLSSHLRMVFVELSKFNKVDIGSLVDNRDAWCYLLRWFEDMGASEKQQFSSRSKAMGEIMGWTIPLTEEEQYQVLADAVEKNRRDRVARDDYVFDQGLEKGREEGREQGREQGREEGMQKGREQGIEKGLEKGIEQVALKMLKEKADKDLISKVTGFSADEIKKLENGS